MLKRVAALLAVAVLPAALAACSSDGYVWEPQPHPSAQSDGYQPPTGPHTLTARLTAVDATYDADGYIDMRADGTCALDLKISGRNASAEFAGEVVKPFDGPAYRREVQSVDAFTFDTTYTPWADTRNVATVTDPAFMLFNPFSIVLSGNPDTTSWCYLTALPSITNEVGPSDGGDMYEWNRDALNAYVKSESDMFIEQVVDGLGLQGTARSMMANRMAEVNPTDAGFVQFASPLIVRQDGNATVLTYRIGETGELSVTLTPTDARTVATPEGAAPWSFSGLEQAAAELGPEEAVRQLFSGGITP